MAKDISAAILKAPAEDGKPAKYWPKDDQVKNVEDVFRKYDKQHVWTSRAKEVRRELAHGVEKSSHQL